MRVHITIILAVAAAFGVLLIAPLYSVNKSDDETMDRGSDGVQTLNREELRPIIALPNGHEEGRTVIEVNSPSSHLRSLEFENEEAGERQKTDSSLETPPPWASRYNDMSSKQLFDEGRALQAVYVDLAFKAAQQHRNDPTRRIYTDHSVDESEWDGLIFSRSSNGTKEFRIVVDQEERPDIYDLRDEVVWLFARSDELKVREHSR